jgi:hypothetical protein
LIKEFEVSADIGHRALELMTIKKKPFVDQEAAWVVDVL